MAEEDLTMKMRARGARETKRDVDAVARSVRRLGRNSKAASTDISVFTRATQFMQTRVIVGATVVSVLGAAAAGAAPLLALLTVAVVALAGVIGPIAAITVGAFQRFGDTASIAGSAANELKKALDGIQHAWNVAISPAASIAMRGLADALEIVSPLLTSMRVPLATFATSMAAATKVFAEGLVALGPELRELVSLSGPLLEALAPLAVAMTAAFVEMARVGIPVLTKITEWLTSFFWWLRKATTDVDAFVRSAKGTAIVDEVFRVVAEVATYVADVIADLASIVWKLHKTFLPLTRLLAGALLTALDALRDGLDWLNRNFETLKTLMTPVIAAMAAYGVAMAGVALYTAPVTLATLATSAWAAATGALGFAMNMLPIVRWITLIVGLGTAIYVAYQKSDTFRGIVHKVVNALKDAAIWAKNAAYAVKDWLGGAFDWVADKAEWLWEKMQPVLKGLKKMAEYSPVGLLNKAVGVAEGVTGVNVPLAGRKAAGGPVRNSGVYEVGERGRERVWLPGGSYVQPAHAMGGEVTVPVTLVMPGGEVLAREVVRATMRKRSVS